MEIKLQDPDTKISYLDVDIRPRILRQDSHNTNIYFGGAKERIVSVFILGMNGKCTSISTFSFVSDE